jgi:Zn-dependent peptidase ImmA (M78 family)
MFNIHSSNNVKDLKGIKFNIIHVFTNFCIKYLGINEDFNLYLVSNDDKIPEMTFACFDLKNNDIYVISNNRHALDICRSIAHELVHLKQKQDNEIDLSKYTDIGGKIEDDANSIAGRICKEFMKKYNAKWLYKLT